MASTSTPAPAPTEPLLIDGERRPAADGATFPSYDPSTREVIAHVSSAGETDVDAAVRAAHRAFADDSPWRRMSPAERARRLMELARLIDANAEELAELETRDNGKPLLYSRVVDVPGAVKTLEYYAGWPARIDGTVPPVSIPDMHAYVTREPVGVCALISAWNFPLVNATWKIAPALAAGCTVVYKAAEQTPLSALRLGELALEAGIPAGVLNIVNGGAETGAALVRHPLVAKVSFTGSVETGRKIAAAAGDGLKRVTLELGGKSPNIVLPDADLEAAIPGSFSGMYFNSGQVCSAATRLFVHRSRYDEVVGGIAEAARRSVVGPGSDPNAFIGPLVSAEQHERVSGYVETGRGEANLVAGGSTDPLGDGGWFVEPTLFETDDDQATIVREEIFGPVLVAQAYDSLEEVARRANDTEFGLAAGIWTQDLSNAHKLARLLHAGTVYVNCFGATDLSVPFGGFKASGFGRELGAQGLDAFLDAKSVMVQL